MIAAGTQATPLPDATTTQNTGVELTQIFLSVAPFLNGVQQKLAEQVAAFDPEIAPYAEYALSRQGKYNGAVEQNIGLAVSSCDDLSEM